MPSEWFFSKALQILDEAPEIYAAADRMIEAADWIVWQMTGQERRNECSAGYKGMWIKGKGFPSPDFLRGLHPGFETVSQKLTAEFHPLGGARRNRDFLVRSQHDNPAAIEPALRSSFG